MSTLEHRSSGLIAARDSMDEVAVAAALKRLDRDLALHYRRDDAELVNVYKVVHVPSGLVVLTWMDEHGQPLPLSSALVEAVQRLAVGARNKPPSEDEHNARLVEERRRDVARENDALIDDHRPHIERERVSVALGVSGRPRYWRREQARPKSGRGG